MYSKVARLFCISIVLASGQAIASELDLGSSSCSGVSTFDIFDVASIDCTGDFLIDGNSLTSEFSISISANGQLSLENIYLNAPSISLYSRAGEISLGPGVLIEANEVVVEAVGVDSIFNVDQSVMTIITSSNDPITLNSSEISQILSSGEGVQLIGSGNLELAPVPVPASFVLFLSGLLPLLIRRVAKGKNA